MNTFRTDRFFCSRICLFSCSCLFTFMFFFSSCFISFFFSLSLSTHCACDYALLFTWIRLFYILNTFCSWKMNFMLLLLLLLVLLLLFCCCRCCCCCVLTCAGQIPFTVIEIKNEEEDKIRNLYHASFFFPLEIRNASSQMRNVYNEAGEDGNKWQKKTVKRNNVGWYINLSDLCVMCDTNNTV